MKHFKVGDYVNVGAHVREVSEDKKKVVVEVDGAYMRLSAALVWDLDEESTEPEEWISVDRRLPETTGEYYCCFVTHMGTQKHCAILKFKSGYFWGADSQTREVTHWFSLPKPPEHAQKGK